MKYFLDTEFIEGVQSKSLFNSLIHKAKPTIDLISIGIVDDNGREYYAISKDFNLIEAWNRFEMKQVYGDQRNVFPEGVKVYWLRENVLKAIFVDLCEREGVDSSHYSCHLLKKLILAYGKSNKQIAEEVKLFVLGDYNHPDKSGSSFYQAVSAKNNPPEFYADYTSYDWVVFCWLFGKMNDLPEGFPMYCNDLRQMLVEKQSYLQLNNTTNEIVNLETHPYYPKQDFSKKHHALEDAKWDKQLYNFIISINDEFLIRKQID